MTSKTDYTRIVIIGNGFDKAHGLETGYNDFMKWLLDSTARYEIVNGSNKLIGSNPIKSNQYHRIKKDRKYDKWIRAIANDDYTFKLVAPNDKSSYYLKSLYTEFKEKSFWSDLESHYFNILFKRKSNRQIVKIINEEFEHIKSLLEEYLINKIENFISYDKAEELIDEHYVYKLLRPENPKYIFTTNHFLTFNYTSKLLKSYINSLSREYGNENINYQFHSPIHIHGKLNDKNNPIIFGYGDENSAKYEELELLEENELLKNFKTFQYLRSDQYNNILSLLETDGNIYVQIIGHSCGMCDKALLRTIFQHPNVKKIEANYYSDDSKYFNNLYNISRIFDDNTMMREKLVPLSQTGKIE